MKPFKKTAKIPAFNTSLKNLKGEQWREVPDFDGDYLISNYGRIKAMSRLIQRGSHATVSWTKTRILNQWIGKNYNQYVGDFTFSANVSLYKSGKRKIFSVRRLVYEAFIQPQINEDSKRMLVYNKDGNGLNNYYTNLAVGTKSFLRRKVYMEKRGTAVALYADQEKRKKHIHKLNKGKRKAVVQYSLEDKELARFTSITQASKKTGVSTSVISACARATDKQGRGFIWRFDEM